MDALVFFFIDLFDGYFFVGDFLKNNWLNNYTNNLRFNYSLIIVKLRL